MTPPGGPDRDHASTRFVADSFAWLGFIFPGLWLLFHRCWLFGIVTLAAQGMLVWLSDQPGLFWGGTLSELAIGLLVGLEGRQILARRLVAKGWAVADIVTAPDLQTAEQIYFAGLPVRQPQPDVPVTDWKNLTLSGPPRLQTGPALGLFDLGGGR
nr:DUF2628 domain-containing protein [Rhizobium sp. SSA_523]